MKIIYRIYEKGDSGSGFWGNYDNILNQDVCICNSREEFKDMMRSMYGEDLAFRNSKKLEKGKPYVVIISENCYDAEEYVTVMDFTCSCCGREFKAIPKGIKKFTSLYELRALNQDLLTNRASEIENMVFCCEACKTKKLEELKDEFKEYNEVHDLVPNTWIDKDTFLGFHEGYIYKISKKSTGEFYVGQTKYNPIFRWGQHLTTDRFCMENIEDYVFEILETIRDSNNLGLKAREAYWINKEREKCPEKCLNTQIPDAEKWEEKLQEGNQTNVCTE